MPRPAKPARLYLRTTPGRPKTWVILHRGREFSTGCGEGDLEGAQEALRRHLGEVYETPTGPQALENLLIADVMNIYLREHAPSTRRVDVILCAAAPIIEWWEGKTLADIKGKTCREYVEWRTAQTVRRQVTKQLARSKPSRLVSRATARSDLAYLSAAINYYHREHGPLPAIPVVALPPPSPARERWLSRKEVAALLFAAWRNDHARHLARLILLGVYTGTRSRALMGLRWIPSTKGGWVDLENGVIHRRGQGVAETRKRQPVMKIPAALLPHLERWREADRKLGVTHVVHFQGEPITKLRRSWATACKTAGLSGVTPHVLRHTAATWLMQAGEDKFQTAGFLGMSLEMLERVYGHHHPEFQADVANSSRRRSPKKSQETPRTKRA